MNTTEIESFTIRNKSGIALTVLNYGAIIQNLLVPDKNEKPVNVVVGYVNKEDYLNNPLYFGACIGSYAGRISNGKFILEKKEYELYHDDGVHLHGGEKGFDQRFWIVDELTNEDEPSIKLSYISPDMEEGYPGNVKVEVIYQLTNDNALKITHTAFTDMPTVLNLTNHSYFNLGDSTSINDHDLCIKASKYLEIQENKLPTGTILNVADTSYDFRKNKKIGAVKMDDTFIFGNTKKEQISLYSEKTGIEMITTTNQPAAVVYTPKNFEAICFETQNFPDAPNHAHFPSALLKPGETYKNETTFKFKIR